MTIKTHTVHLYLLTNLNPPTEVFEAFDWRQIDGCMKGRVYLGAREIEIDWPDVDTNDQVIESLRNEIESERAQSQMRVNLLLERISKLQAIGHDAEVAQ